MLELQEPNPCLNAMRCGASASACYTTTMTTTCVQAAAAGVGLRPPHLAYDAAAAAAAVQHVLEPQTTAWHPVLKTTDKVVELELNHNNPAVSDGYDFQHLQQHQTVKSEPSSMEEESPTNDDDSSSDHLHRLQLTLAKNGLLAAELADEESKSEDDDGVVDVPRINSHGKVKTFKCKQCDFVAVTKLDFWDHSRRRHIKAEKLLTCSKCPFVTEYKHHLEYHLRNHFGSKPFKCDKCSYSCVNKSMLNSHMKSHSNVYQYRCSDCNYATKYCHSLKLHLRKYGHKPAMVLNPDGSPNPLPIIDVYGTRRGPKQRTIKAEESQPQPSFLSQPLHIPFPYAPLLGAFANNLLFPFSQERSPSPPSTTEPTANEPLNALDLSKPDQPLKTPNKSRRKGKAVKLERPPIQPIQPLPTQSDYNCQYCDIAFKDVIMYTMHMGYHGYKDPFTCNMCGEQSGDKVAFFLHIARNSHS